MGCGNSLPEPQELFGKGRGMIDAGSRFIVITTHMPNGNTRREIAYEGENKGVYLTASGNIITIETVKG
jgi:hypothetical protein